MNERKGIITRFFKSVDEAEVEMKGEEFFVSPVNSEHIKPEGLIQRVVKPVRDTLDEIHTVLSGRDLWY